MLVAPGSFPGLEGEADSDKTNRGEPEFRPPRIGTLHEVNIA